MPYSQYSFVTIEYMQTVARLINSFIPEAYNLSVVLERQQRTFSGTVSISGSSLGDTIKLHAKDLTINDVVVDGRRAESAHGDDDELTITQDGLVAGKHIIVLGFSGTITDAMHGLYPCYFEHDGEAKELLATQFESHHAREVFPCVDEPAAKATFDVTITSEQGVTVLGNMPVIHSQEEDEKLVTTFDTTPKMSTYLLAWVVGELHRETATTNGGVEVNVWATKAQPKRSLAHALNAAVRTIDFFDEYFQTPYPLTKSDHVALPDFSSGAMENWGLITYREIALLADPESTSISTKRYIATVVAHELSHQWFGNLVTMKWWNNLWLNESFATLMEYIAVDALWPEWNIWLDFASHESIMALRRDAIDGVQSVQIDVNHPDEISTLFDGAIVYAKGARLLQMLRTYVGDDAFQTGLRSYFAEFAYSNTEGDDLWKKLAESSGKDVATMMDTWISQPGFPLVSASLTGTMLRLKQEQLFVGPHKTSERKWPIPLRATIDSLPDTLEEQQIELTHEHQETTVLRLNDGDTSHFITKYDDTLLKAITDSIAAGNESPLTRLQILHEQTMLARSGNIPSATIIPLLAAYSNERNDAAWDILSLALGELKKFVQTDEIAEKQLRAFAGTLSASEFQRLGWDSQQDEPENDTKLRATIIGMQLYAENNNVIGEAIRRFKATSLEKIDPEQRAIIIGAAVRHGDDEIAGDLLHTYSTTSSAELQQDIAAGVTSTKDPELVRQLLATFTDSTKIRTQDLARWFVYLIRGRESRDQTWQWLQDNWQWIEKTFGGDKSFDDFPRYAASGLATRNQLEEYTSFFTPIQSIPALQRVIAIGIGEIEGRVELIERDGDDVRIALNKP